MTAVAALLVGLAAAGPQGASPARDADLTAGIEALADFRPHDAVEHLERARRGGPHAHADHVRLYEQLGIAYAYLGRSDAARAAFRRLLALDPTAAISYTLSPKVTFLFEQARQAAAERRRPTLDVRWPSDLTTEDPVRIDLEVVADPERFFRRGRVMFRLTGQPEYRRSSFRLGGADAAPTIVDLGVLAAGAEAEQTLELYVVAEDERGNEVLTYAGPDRPRTVQLRAEAPDPWYGRWWVWVAAGAVVAAAAGSAVYVATRDPPDTVEGRFVIGR